MTAGRSCPLHYRYRPETLGADPVVWDEDVIYVIGGLYGNPFALDEIEAMAARERDQGRRVRLLFNGDFNWFNAADAGFRNINERVLAHDAILGNVEYELAHPSDGAGCGCAYPDFVGSEVVERSNRIMERLQAVAAGHPDLQQRLAGLSRWRCVMFGGLKIIFLHGDPESLAGWGLARETLIRDGGDTLADWFRRTGADAIISTHTCLPLIWQGQVDGRPRRLLNNGSAGMPNLARDGAGLIARIARSTASGEAVTALSVASTADLPGFALEPVRFPTAAWIQAFDRLWPAGSDAAVSYRERITTGTDLHRDEVFMTLADPLK